MKRMWSENELRKIIQETYGIDINNLIDKDGHERFIEGELTLETIEGITFTYAKWSLSGSHLMIVLCGTAAVGSYSGNLAKCELPDWIFDKIIPVSDDYIDVGNKPFYYTYNVQNVTIQCKKYSNYIAIDFATSTTISTNDKSFRIAYDFLIDNE